MYDVLHKRLLGDMVETVYYILTYLRRTEHTVRKNWFAVWISFRLFTYFNCVPYCGRVIGWLNESGYYLSLDNANEYLCIIQLNEFSEPSARSQPSSVGCATVGSDGRDGGTKEMRYPAKIRTLSQSSQLQTAEQVRSQRRRIDRNRGDGPRNDFPHLLQLKKKSGIFFRIFFLSGFLDSRFVLYISPKSRLCLSHQNPMHASAKNRTLR